MLRYYNGNMLLCYQFMAKAGNALTNAVVFAGTFTAGFCRRDSFGWSCQPDLGSC